MRDTEQSRTYAVENMFGKILDRQHECPTFTIAGSTVTLPVEYHFADLENIQRYVDKVAPGAQVRATRSDSNTAHHRHRDGMLSFPIHRPDADRTPWAMRELVVLHEVAHYLTPRGTPAHGKKFRQTFTDLVSQFMGPEAGFVLQVMFAEAGL